MVISAFFPRAPGDGGMHGFAAKLNGAENSVTRIAAVDVGIDVDWPMSAVQRDVTVEFGL